MGYQTARFYLLATRAVATYFLKPSIFIIYYNFGFFETCNTLTGTRRCFSRQAPFLSDGSQWPRAGRQDLGRTGGIRVGLSHRNRWRALQVGHGILRHSGNGQSPREPSRPCCPRLSAESSKATKVSKLPAAAKPTCDLVAYPVMEQAAQACFGSRTQLVLR